MSTRSGILFDGVVFLAFGLAAVAAITGLAVNYGATGAVDRMEISGVGPLVFAARRVEPLGVTDASAPLRPQAVPTVLPLFPPSILKCDLPQYPAESLRSGVEGVVLLSLVVSETGNVRDASVKASSGSLQLDERARSGAYGWKFRPARRGGSAVASRFELPVRFEIN